MKVTRRKFLKGGMATFTVGFVGPALLAEMASAQTATHRNLVVLFLDGGIDGLSVLIPHDDPYYYSRRPTVSLLKEDVLPIGSDAAGRALGFHPRLTGLRDIYEDGNLAIMPRVGYENSSRSHFSGTDYWSTADPTNTIRFGWLGRYLDSLDLPVDPLYAWNTTYATPRTLLAPLTQVPAIPNVRAYSYRTTNGGSEAELERAWATRIASHVPVDRPHLALVQRSMGDALATVDRVARVGEYQPSSDVTYPSNGFGNALKMVAGAIIQEVGSKIFFVRTGGFDTHAQQETRQGYFFNLMASLNDGLAAFYQDLRNQGALNDTMIMSFSEFSRRIDENGSGGTDHGGGNTLLVIGGAVNGGLYGTAPDLNNDDTENPTLESSGRDVRHETDFRSVYATVADSWLQTDSVDLLLGNFRDARLDFV